MNKQRLRICIIATLSILATFLPCVNTQATEVQSSQSIDRQEINKCFYIHQEYPDVIKHPEGIYVPIYDSPDINLKKIGYLVDSVFVISEENGWAKVLAKNGEKNYAFIPLKYLYPKPQSNVSSEELEVPKFEINYPYKQEITDALEEIINYSKDNIVISSIVGALIIVGFILLSIKYPLFRKVALRILAIIGIIIGIVLVLNVIIFIIKYIIYMIYLIIKAIIYIIGGFIALLWLLGGGAGRQWDRDHKK